MFKLLLMIFKKFDFQDKIIILVKQYGTIIF